MHIKNTLYYLTHRKQIKDVRYRESTVKAGDHLLVGQYTSKEKRAFTSRLRNKTKAWEDTRIIRLLLLMIPTIIALYRIYTTHSYLYENTESIVYSLSGAIAINLAPIIIMLIPYECYHRFKTSKCIFDANERCCQVLYFEQDMLTEEYLPLHTSGYKKEYHDIKVNYNKISKLVYNKTFDFIDVYGKWTDRHFSFDDSSNQYKVITKTTYGKNTKHPENRYFRIYLCYKNNDEILALLKEKTGLVLNTDARTESDIWDELKTYHNLLNKQK